MIKIIETNLSMDNENNIKDHQSRVIEIDNWDFYTRIFNEYNPLSQPIEFDSVIGNMYGCVLARNAKITHLEYDDFHLRCETTLWSGFRQIKLAYIAERGN